MLQHRGLRLSGRVRLPTTLREGARATEGATVDAPPRRWSHYATTYDDRGRPLTVEDSNTGLYTYVWAADGTLERLDRPRGLAEVPDYGPGQRLDGVLTTVDGEPLHDLSVALDDQGRPATVTDWAGEHAYTYDDAGQLLSATHPPASGLADEAYTYDPNGNRTSWADHPPEEVAYDPTADLLEQDDQFLYGHDFEGRLVLKEHRDTGDTTRFVWNSFDELVAVEHPDGTATTFTYDALGRRIAVTHAGQTWRFAHAGDAVQATYDADDRLLSWATTGLGGELLATWDPSTGVVTDALLDRMGTVAGWHGPDGTTWVPRDSFGNALDAPEAPEPHAFTWHTQDPTGLVYARARYLDPATGRFLSEDPVESGNRYAYAGNSPTMLWDPSGAMAAERGVLDEKTGTASAGGARPIGKTIACTIAQEADIVSTVAESFAAQLALEFGVNKACGARRKPKGGRRGGGGDSTCFVAGTQVLTPLGPLDIAELRVGDPVLVQDELPFSAGHVDGGPMAGVRPAGGVARVTRTYRHIVDEVVDLRIEHSDGSSEVISGTAEHPFWVGAEGAWVPLGRLVEGDVLTTDEGGPAAVVGLARRTGEREVFNIEVAGPHNFFVRGADSTSPGTLVHNKDPALPDLCVPGPFAGGSIPARGPGRGFRTAEKAAVNALGEAFGCHSCGAPVSGRSSGNWTLDHQPVSILLELAGLIGTPQRLFPQCSRCSCRQGGYVSGVKRKSR